MTTKTKGSKNQLADVDPGTVIPPSVAAAAAKADELHKSVYSKEPAEPATPPEPPVTPEVTAPAEPPVEPAPAPEPPQPPTPANDNWEHKYNSMKGRAEKTEKLTRQMAETIAGLQSTIAAMQARPTEPASTELEAIRLITPEEEKDYGTEFLSVVKKAASEVATPEVKALQKQLKNLEDRLKGVGDYVVQNDRTRMLQRLDESLPNWKELNTNQNFLDWLALPDAFSGAIRQELLNAAYEQNNAPRVLAFFNGFLAEEAAVAPQPTTPAAPAPTAQKVPLENFAAPGRAKTAAAPAPTEKPHFTRSEVSQFYIDKRRGVYRGRDAECEQLERQIVEAGREGRIR